MISKKLLSLFLFFICTSIGYAGHEVGGVILTYKSTPVGGNVLTYEVTAYALYDLQGPFVPASMNVSVSSSCYSTMTVSLTRINNPSGGATTPVKGVDYCTSATPAASTTGLATFKGTLTLPGTCSDFRFFVASGYGRFSNTINIAFNFSNNYFYAKLNNIHGPNSCPQIDLSSLIQTACLNKPLNLYSITEPDGDSLFFSSSVPNYVSGGTVSNLSYNPGYSVANPVASTAGYSVNPATGKVQTQLPISGNYVITIKYQEYAYDTTQSIRVMVGESRYSMMLYGTPSCYTPPFDLTRNAMQSDSLNCGDSTIYFAATRRVASNTLTLTGSEFTVSSQRSGAMSVASARVFSDSLIEIKLNQPIQSNDVITVVADTGTDNNVIYSHCGQELMANNDTLTYYSTILSYPVASFNYSTSFLSANFNSTATGGSILSWNFGDGSPLNSSLNPIHSYSSAGTYPVTLIVTNSCGDTDTIVQNIMVCDSLIATYTYTINGDTVNFNASGSMGASSFIWDFGDGNTGTGSSFTHYYTNTGSYFVTLTVVNVCGDTTTFSDSIILCVKPLASWTYSIISSGGGGLKIQFDGTASTNASYYVWDFGDGNTNTTSATPIHTYTTVSLSYLVSLKVGNSCADEHIKAFRLDQIGINEYEPTTHWELYPNPARDYLVIQSDEKNPDLERVLIHNSMGQMILARDVDINDLTENFEMDISSLAEGMYTVQLIGQNASSTQTIIVIN